MIPVSKAINIIDREINPLGVESIALEKAVGRVLAENIITDSDMPPFDRSQMDGFAVRSMDLRQIPATLRLVGESAAGRGWHNRLGKGEAIRIMTGAPVPVGADAVQKLEVVEECEGLVTVLEYAEKGKFIVRRGSELKKAAVLFQRGEVITEGMVPGIAAFGYSRVKTSVKPSVAILSTGSEIVPVDKIPGRDQIRNSNSVMLKVFCEQAGASARSLSISGDDLTTLKSRISKAANDGKTDVLVITGGVSVGKYDLTKAALKELGAEIFFEKVRLKPGKPAVFARLGKLVIFGLPGNPISSAVTFYLFVRRAVRRMQNAKAVALRSGYAVSAGRMKAAAERETYLPVALETNKEGMLLAKPLKWGGSSDFVGFARAEAMALIQRGETVESGDQVRISFL
jgi:molybdenum cofactor synthesis domain-containing protein